MKRQAILFSSTMILALTAISCSSTANENSVGTTGNSNAAVVVNATNTNLAPGDDPTAKMTPPPMQSSNIPGIPNVPGTEKPISKEDPTRNAKVQTASRPAPDNSEIFGPTLGENIVETRVFKNNAQIAKIEKTQDTKTKKTTVKVFLRNGQVRELPEAKAEDSMSESANNILKILAGGGAAAQTKPETKPAPQPETTDNQKKP